MRLKINMGNSLLYGEKWQCAELSTGGYWTAGEGAPKAVAECFNLLAPELFFLILAHPVYKMWIIQEPNTLELWNKLHFEEKKTESI